MKERQRHDITPHWPTHQTTSSKPSGLANGSTRLQLHFSVKQALGIPQAAFRTLPHANPNTTPPPQCPDIALRH